MIFAFCVITSHINLFTRNLYNAKHSYESLRLDLARVPNLGITALVDTILHLQFDAVLILMVQPNFRELY